MIANHAGENGPKRGSRTCLSSGRDGHDLLATSTPGRKNWLPCGDVGGLNFQVEHHLFRKECRIHDPALRSHYRSLASLGRQPLAAAA